MSVEIRSREPRTPAAGYGKITIGRGDLAPTNHLYIGRGDLAPTNHLYIGRGNLAPTSRLFSFTVLRSSPISLSRRLSRWTLGEIGTTHNAASSGTPTAPSAIPKTNPTGRSSDDLTNLFKIRYNTTNLERESL